MAKITITIKRRIKCMKSDFRKCNSYNENTSDKQYLFDNMHRRHNLYNLAIEIMRDRMVTNPNLTSYDVAKIIYNEYESKDELYGYYATGIRERVIDSIYQMKIKMDILSRDNPREYGTLNQKYRFKKYTPSKMSFSIGTKPLTRSDGSFVSKIKYMDNKSITISMNKSRYMTFTIKDETFNNKNHPYTFDIPDIKQVHFLYKNGKFYILLVVNVDTNSCFTDIYERKPLVGIDLGEKNPIASSDDGMITNVKIEKFPDSKIESIDKRVDKLQHHLDKKEFKSKNYYKILEKINRLKERQYNIRLDWRNKLAFQYVTKYNIIIM